MAGNSIRLCNIDEETNKPLSSDELVGFIKGNTLHVTVTSADEDLRVIVSMVATLVDIVSKKHPSVTHGVLDFNYPGTRRVRDSSGEVVVNEKGYPKIEISPYCKNLTTIVHDGDEMVAESIVGEEVSTFGDPKRPGKQMCVPLEYFAKWFEINLDLQVENKIKCLALEEVGKPDKDGWMVAGAHQQKGRMKQALAKKLEDQIIKASKGKLMG